MPEECHVDAGTERGGDNGERDYDHGGTPELALMMASLEAPLAFAFHLATMIFHLTTVSLGRHPDQTAQVPPVVLPENGLSL
jgi:hypothetical protein